jgi:hypothetical protein
MLTLGAASAQAAEKSESICTSGDVVRRVVVEVGDLNSGLPCEVVYWKDNEAPGERRVLWNARSDAAFCDGKAAGLVDKLSTAGWNCGNNAAAADAAATPPTPSTAAAATGTGLSTSESLPSAAQAQAPAAIEPAAAAPSSLAPSATAGLTDGIEAAPSDPSADSTQELQTAAVAPTAPVSPAAPAVSAPPADANLDQLQTVIDANLASLNQTVDGDFQAKIGDFGDLDRDGIQDAVVFFNYESSTADFTQFVAAYLFDGENYRLAATKPVGGTDLAVRQVDVEEIVDGSIQLRLVLNDAAQSENRRAAMILKDGQLVEIQ